MRVGGDFHIGPSSISRLSIRSPFANWQSGASMHTVCRCYTVYITHNESNILLGKKRIFRLHTVFIKDIGENTICQNSNSVQ